MTYTKLKDTCAEERMFSNSIPVLNIHYLIPVQLHLSHLSRLLHYSRRNQQQDRQQKSLEQPLLPADGEINLSYDTGTVGSLPQGTDTGITVMDMNKNPDKTPLKLLLAKLYTGTGHTIQMKLQKLYQYNGTFLQTSSPENHHRYPPPSLLICYRTSCCNASCSTWGSKPKKKD